MKNTLTKGTLKFFLTIFSLTFVSTYCFAQMSNQDLSTINQNIEQIITGNMFVFLLPLVPFFIIFFFFKYFTQDIQPKEATTQKQPPIIDVFEQLTITFENKKTLFNSNVKEQFDTLANLTTQINSHPQININHENYNKYISLIKNLYFLLDNCNERIINIVQEDIQENLTNTTNFLKQYLQSLDTDNIKNIKISNKYNKNLYQSA